MKTFKEILVVLSIIGIVIGGLLLTNFFARPKPVSVQQKSPTTSSYLAVLVCLDKLPPMPENVDRADARFSLTQGDWAAKCLVEEAKNLGVDIKISGRSDVIHATNNPLGAGDYQHFGTILLSGDSFDAVQKIILIDFVKAVDSHDHHALKRGCRLIIE